MQDGDSHSIMSSGCRLQAGVCGGCEPTAVLATSYREQNEFSVVTTDETEKMKETLCYTVTGSSE